MVELGAEGWLKPADVVDGSLASILEEGGIVKAEDTQFGHDQLYIVVKYNSVKYKWGPNALSRKNCAKAWGGDTKMWVGHDIKLNKVKVSVRGEMKDSIVAEPVV